jgi:Fibronectin type III domain
VYSLSCTGAGGTISQSTTVTVTAANNGTATLTWVPPTENTNGTPVTPLTGYHIYYGKTEGALNQSIVVSGAGTTSYEITGLSSGTWYFAVAAMAADGTESPQSNVGSKTI